MAARRRIGRRSTINPGIILLSASNLLSEIEYLQPSSLEMRDIGALIDRVRAAKQNLRRLRSGSVEQRILDRIIRGLEEMRRYLEEIKIQLTYPGSLRGYNAPRVYTGIVNLQATLLAASFQHPSGPDGAFWPRNYSVFARETTK